MTLLVFSFYPVPVAARQADATGPPPLLFRRGSPLAGALVFLKPSPGASSPSSVDSPVLLLPLCIPFIPSVMYVFAASA